MAKLDCMTRGNSSFEKKQKVYFSAHPKDHGLLKRIAGEILEYQNCAVWYDREPEEEFDPEELAENLSRMQLFVMPVTYELLTTPNRAMDFEFPLALREHIPILPLVQEGNLDALFNQKCGDLQYLYKAGGDDTGISYEDKLRTFLDSVLVGDAEAEQIRNAFAAYIFLSYRKKDRQHAQKLMQLIHQVESCRDVAIWYDEFLTPGENFSQLIADALAKSSLFVLSVTPNVLEDANYVMQTEYPMATSQCKPVLPAQMVDTQAGVLRQKYQGIPDSVDPYDTPALQKALEAMLGDAIAHRDDSPEHMYRMGLAYLNGIDVEKDSAKAEQLIRTAADREYVPAMEKMVQMYRNGEGVERSMKNALSWQDKLVCYWDIRYAQTGAEEDARGQFHAMKTKIDFRKDMARDVTFPAMDLYTAASAYAEKFDSRWARRALSISLERLGDTSAARRDFLAALGHYRRSLDISISLADQEDTPAARRDVAAGYAKLGDLNCKQGDLAAALSAYTDCLGIRSSVYEKDPRAAAAEDLADVHQRISRIFCQQGELRAALGHCNKALELYSRLEEENGGAADLWNVSGCWQDMGGICWELGYRKEAISFLQNSLAKAREYEKRRGTAKAKVCVTQRLSVLASRYTEIGQYKAAVNCCEEAIGINEDLLKAGRSLELMYDRARFYMDLGNVWERRGDLEQAEDCYKKSLRVIERFSPRQRNLLQSRQLMAHIHGALAWMFEKRQDWENGQNHCRKALELDIRIAQEEDTPVQWQNVVLRQGQLADFCCKQGQWQEAREQYEATIALQREKAREYRTLHSTVFLATCYSGLGEACRKLRDLSAAEAGFRMCLETLLPVTGDDAAPELRCRLAQAHFSLGEFYRDCRKPDMAAAHLKTAADLFGEAGEKQGDPGDLEKQAIAYCYLGTLDPADVDIMVLYDAEMILDALIAKYPDNPRYTALRNWIQKKLF